MCCCCYCQNVTFRLKSKFLFGKVSMVLSSNSLNFYSTYTMCQEMLNYFGYIMSFKPHNTRKHIFAITIFMDEETEVAR